MIRDYAALLGKRRQPHVLDIGPVCGENINFFLPRVQTFFSCDLFLRLHHDLLTTNSSSIITRHLDFKAKSFDAIHLWDFCDRLDHSAITILIDACRRLLKNEGIVVMTAYNEQFTSPPINSFVIGNRYTVTLREQSHLHLPYFFRHNRDINLAFSSFELEKSYVYRNKYRELLFTFKKN
jgi:hypothetical protein